MLVCPSVGIGGQGLPTSPSLSSDPEADMEPDGQGQGPDWGAGMRADMRESLGR